MRCEVCKREMTALFLTWVCDYCDGLRDTGPTSTGWIVWRRRPPGSEEYVFRSPEDAERWREVSGLGDCAIRKVETEAQIHWRKSTGNVEDVELADHLFQIFADHRYEPGPHRAHLV